MRKLIASILTAIISLATFAFPAMAATNLGMYPDFLFTDGNLNAFVVVGADAQPADVVGGIDLAVRLAGNSVVTKTLTGTASLGVTGLDRDGIGLGVASGGSALDACVSTGSSSCSYSNTFPTGNVVKNFHFTGLLDTTLTWRSNQYDVAEDIDLSGVRMRHDYGTSNINGTEKMEVQSGDVIYEYVFKKTLTGIGGSAASGTGGPNYTYPVEVKLLGVPFTIVGAGTNQVRILQGSLGVATATNGVSYGMYTVYSDVGSTDSWARILVKDATGKTVDTLTVNVADSKDSAAAGLTVKLTSVKTIGTSGDVASANVVVGPTGTVEKLYDTTADTTSTGTASDKFPGTTEWGIRVAPGNFSTEGQITANDRLQVIYQPTSTKYLVAGDKVVLPNNYGELGYAGFGTNKFATVTVEPITSVSAYNSSGNVVGSNLNGFRISSDVSGSVVSLGGNGYDAGYFLFGPQGVASGTTGWPIYVGFWDKANSRIKTADTVTTGAANATVYHQNSTSEFAWYNITTANISTGVSYGFRVSYQGAGEKTFWLNLTAYPNNLRIVTNFTTSDDSTGPGINLGAFNNKTVWGTSAPEFRLGVTASSAESADVNLTTEGTAYTVGTSTQNVVDDTGLILVSPNSNSASDKVVVMYPSRELTARVYFGKSSGSTTTTGSSTYNEPLPVKTAVAKLDSEVSDPATVGKHLVLIGGPAVNMWTAKAMGLDFPTYGSSGLLPFSEGQGYVSLHDGVFKTGQMVVTVQGWDAKDTRNAASVLQQWDDFASKLKGNMAVKVTSVSAAGITPA